VWPNEKRTVAEAADLRVSIIRIILQFHSNPDADVKSYPLQLCFYTRSKERYGVEQLRFQSANWRTKFERVTDSGSRSLII
jgi:hypothetical protein